jgi:L-amino acid N-acyltransferase YncA
VGDLREPWLTVTASPTLLEAPADPASDTSEPGEWLWLRDGSRVSLRAVRHGDEESLLKFLEGLCVEARRLRFFSGAVDLNSAAHWASLTSADRHGLIAHDESGEVIGHAAYVLLDSDRAEVAVEVADHLHGQGLGTLLVERLAAIAEQRGVRRFVAEVLCENRAMLDVFKDGFDARMIRHDGPEERVEFLTSGWRLAHERFPG